MASSSPDYIVRVSHVNIVPQVRPTAEIMAKPLWKSVSSNRLRGTAGIVSHSELLALSKARKDPFIVYELRHARLALFSEPIHGLKIESFVSYTGVAVCVKENMCNTGID